MLECLSANPAAICILHSIRRPHLIVHSSRRLESRKIIDLLRWRRFAGLRARGRLVLKREIVLFVLLRAGGFSPVPLFSVVARSC